MDFRWPQHMGEQTREVSHGLSYPSAEVVWNDMGQLQDYWLELPFAVGRIPATLLQVAIANWESAYQKPRCDLVVERCMNLCLRLS